MQTTSQECIQSLQDAAEILDKSPTKQEYEELGLTPASATILRVMGGWNDAKEEAGLETYEKGEFGGTDVQPKPEWVNLPDDKEWTELSGNQRWYYKNRERDIAKKDERRNRLRLWLHRYRRDECSCERCDVGHPACLDFHHVGEKDLSVSKMVAYGYSQEKIRAEIDRCVVLCSNCHRREHYSVPEEVETSE